MIIHYGNEEKCVQVRGRYCGDLPKLYIHGPTEKEQSLAVPPQYLNIPIFTPEKEELCKAINLRTPDNKLCKWTTVKKRLQASGYVISEGRRDNKRYAIILPSDTS